MVEEDEEQLGWSCEKWRSIEQSKGKSNIRQRVGWRQTNWIGHILSRDRLLQQFMEGLMEGKREVMGSGGRRNKMLLDDLKEKIEYWKLKQEALDSTLWRIHSGSGYRLVVR